jgi:hypothetical protein
MLVTPLVTPNGAGDGVAARICGYQFSSSWLIL